MNVLHHTRHDTGLPGWVATSTGCSPSPTSSALHVPLTDETRHLIGARELGLMRPTAVLVNTARGPVVDEEALAIALEEQRTIFAAGLDVFEREPEVHPRLLAAPRTVLLPHIGSATTATRTRMAVVASEGARAVLAGERPPNLVTPELDDRQAARTRKHRAGGVVHDVLAHRTHQEPLQHPVTVRADDDDVGVLVLGHPHDHRAGVARFDPPLHQWPPRFGQHRDDLVDRRRRVAFLARDDPLRFLG